MVDYSKWDHIGTVPSSRPLHPNAADVWGHSSCTEPHSNWQKNANLCRSQQSYPNGEGAGAGSGMECRPAAGVSSCSVHNARRSLPVPTHTVEESKTAIIAVVV